MKIAWYCSAIIMISISPSFPKCFLPINEGANFPSSFLCCKRTKGRRKYMMFVADFATFIVVLEETLPKKDPFFCEINLAVSSWQICLH